MNRQERKRRFLLEAYSENLINFANSEQKAIAEPIGDKKVLIQEPVYICPLCLTPFKGIVALAAKPPSLTLEHNPPEHLGGKANLLTCTSCNNSHGGKTDHKIGTDLEKGRFFDREPNSSLTIRAQIGKSHMRSKMIRLNEDTIGIVIDERINDHVAGKFVAAFQEGNFSDIKLYPELPEDDDLNLACLKIAHLDAFRFFGYSYLISSNGRFIVNTLRNKTKPIPAYGLMHMNPPPPLDGLHFATIEDLRFFMVVFTVKSKTTTRMGVLLPGHGEEGLTEYLKFQKPAMSSHQVTVTRLNDHALPLKPPPSNRYKWLWEQCLSGDLPSR